MYPAITLITGGRSAEGHRVRCGGVECCRARARGQGDGWVGVAEEDLSVDYAGLLAGTGCRVARARSLDLVTVATTGVVACQECFEQASSRFSVQWVS
jgi:hypothetical protein